MSKHTAEPKIGHNFNAAMSFGAGGGVDNLTLTGDYTVDFVNNAQFLRMDPGGSSRNVTLPKITAPYNKADEASRLGLWYWIANTADAAENLVVKDAAAATIATLNQNEAAIFVSDGTTWQFLGIMTIAQT